MICSFHSIASAAFRRGALGEVHVIRRVPVAAPGEAVFHKELVAEVAFVNLVGEVL